MKFNGGKRASLRDLHKLTEEEQVRGFAIANWRGVGGPSHVTKTNLYARPSLKPG